MLKKIIFAFLVLFTFISISSVVLSELSIPAISCDKCSSSQCSCSVSGCSSGFFDTFTAFDCTGLSEIETIFKNYTIVWSPGSYGTFFTRIYCDNGKQTACTRLNVTAPKTTTTSTTTITTTTRPSCPYDCCVNDPSYKNKFCLNNEDCLNNKCVKPAPEIPYNLILVVIAILLGTLIFAYAFVKKGTKQDAFESLKRKWGRR